MNSAYALPSGAAAWWAAVNTQPHRERIALDNLERQGFASYCPFIRRRRSHARRVEEVLRPLFPGYLFVNVRSEQNCWRPILSTYGVRTLVRCGDQPSLVDARFIQALQDMGQAGPIVPAAVRDRLGVTRKYLIPLLEWADGRGITVREGEGRRLKSRESAVGSQDRRP